MRKLKTTDILAGCRALKKIGIKDEIEKIAKKAKNAKDAWGMGFDLLWGIVDKATEAKGEAALYDFLAGPFEMTPEDVADLDVSTLIRNLKTLAEENDLPAFFSSVGQATK